MPAETNERAFIETPDAAEPARGSSPESMEDLIGTVGEYFNPDEWPQADEIKPYRHEPFYLDMVMGYAKIYPTKPEPYVWTEELIRERRMGMLIGVALARSLKGERWDWQMDDTAMTALYEDVESARQFFVDIEQRRERAFSDEDIAEMDRWEPDIIEKSGKPEDYQ